MEIKYYIEFRLQSNPSTWRRSTAYFFSSFKDAEADVQSCLKRQEENGEINYESFKDRVLEYRIISLTTTVVEKVLSHFLVDSSSRFLEAKRNELHYLDQVYKYLKHLENIYTTGKLKDENHAWQVQTSLRNTETQRNIVSKKIEELTLKERN